MAEIKSLETSEVEYIMPAVSETDLRVGDNFIENSNISLKIEGDNIFINGIRFSLVDFVDFGDSYNCGPKEDDNGTEFKILQAGFLWRYSYCKGNSDKHY